MFPACTLTGVDCFGEIFNDILAQLWLYLSDFTSSVDFQGVNCFCFMCTNSVFEMVPQNSPKALNRAILAGNIL